MVKSSQFYSRALFTVHSFKAALQKIMTLMLVLSSCLTVAFSKFALDNNIFQ